MNARPLRRFVGLAALAALLLPQAHGLAAAGTPGSALPPSSKQSETKQAETKQPGAKQSRAKQVPSAQPGSEVRVSATAAADDALRPAATRAAPRRLDVNLPLQVSFETGAVQQADITPDGKWLALWRWRLDN